MATRRRDYKAEYRRRKEREAAAGKRRDYKAEYERRLKRILGEGLSRSAARGHPRFGEVGVAEWRQLKRAADTPSPSGWRVEDGRLVRGPAEGPDPLRRAGAERLAEIAGVESPVGQGRMWKLRRAASAEAFVEAFMALGLGTQQQAYTLWFSP